jgi:hypothetical protein
MSSTERIRHERSAGAFRSGQAYEGMIQRGADRLWLGVVRD